MFVFILTSTAEAISKYCLTSVVSQPGIKPGTLGFQDNHEMHYTTEVTSNNISVAANFIIINLLLYIIYILIIITNVCWSHQSPVTCSQTVTDIHSVIRIVIVS